MQTLHEKIELAHRIAKLYKYRVVNCGSQLFPQWVMYSEFGSRIGARKTIDGMLRLVKQVTGYK